MTEYHDPIPEGETVGHKNIGVEIDQVDTFPLGGGGDSTAIMWLLTKVTELEARIAVLEARNRGSDLSN